MVKIGTREEFYKSMWGKEFYWKEGCPFCDIEWQKWHTIWNGKYWYILHNLFPYSWTEKHIMAVPYEHRVYSTDLTQEELAEFKDIYLFAKNFFWEEDYFSCTRETMAIRSLEHFHIHFVPWKLQGSYLIKMLQNQGFPIKEKLDY